MTLDITLEIRRISDMPITIPQSVFDKYYDVVDSTFNIFGVTCQLVYIEKVEETGKTLVGGGKIPSDKNFALHFNAPIGTVIMVTNPENKSTVFVKVTGNF